MEQATITASHEWEWIFVLGRFGVFFDCCCIKSRGWLKMDMVFVFFNFLGAENSILCFNCAVNENNSLRHKPNTDRYFSPKRKTKRIMIFMLLWH